MKRVVLAALVLLTACGRDEVTADDAAKVVRETLTGMREKSVVKIQVRLEKAEMPSADDLQLRKRIEEAIEQEEIGRVKISESGVGRFDIHVEVDSTTDAVPRIRDLLETLEVLERSTVSVASD
ncbi:MAG TPA: hypothetical protein VGQ36_20960 [Thermoanaerobaculia bacterium]|jgi:hypothetical protein|nr:hypothetical protein [Thermoanaerobaculia bacterium]